MKAKGLAKLADDYFKPKSFEKSGRLYEALGVRGFQKLYFMTLGKLVEGLCGQKPGLSDISDESLENYENFTRGLEMIHLPLAAVCSPLVIRLFANGDYKLGAINLAIQALVNYYPIMLQRYNRARVYRILERRKARRGE